MQRVTSLRTLTSFGLLCVLILCGWGGSDKAVAQDVIPVDCSAADQTLGQALQAANPGDIIQISGTCQETVTITTNDLTLDGQGSAIIDGGGNEPGVFLQGAITIDGAQRVAIRGLTVQNGPDGILATRGAAVTLTDLVLQNNADDGIQIMLNSTADMSGMITSMGNADDGILVLDAASLHITDGTVTARENGDDGLSVFGSSALRITNSTVQLEQNGTTDPAGDGLVILSTSTMNTTGEGMVQIVANQNANRGMVISSSATLLFNVPSSTILTNNGLDGLGVFNLSRFSLPAGAELRLENNARFGLIATNVAIVFCAADSAVVLNGNGMASFIADSIVSQECLGPSTQGAARTTTVPASGVSPQDKEDY